ncbi:hypothetical protein VSVS05_00557 [Vibrio scophthalmi]|uniref:Uncharacterized protein n=1 Tax=Vibrio scophthalmi TaxID=45658 RepID=A0A1C7F6U8_9VIBR|nr:hypothetical protein VSVS05_00557 [Vibrio scophthalmi]
MGGTRKRFPTRSCLALENDDGGWIERREVRQRNREARMGEREKDSQLACALLLRMMVVGGLRSERFELRCENLETRERFPTRSYLALENDDGG